MEKMLLIVGLDPGTTTAYAVLDIDGKLIKAKSHKDFGLSPVISEIVELGKAVVVGTDKKKVPNFVELFSMKTGARIISPDEDLKISDKRDAVRNFNISDEHQNDAIASAFFAFRKIKPLTDKVDIILEKNGKTALKNLTKEIVLTKKISIQQAIKMLEMPRREEVTTEKTQKRELSEKEFFRLRENLKAARTDNIYIRMQNERLMQRLMKAESIMKRQKFPKPYQTEQKAEGILNFKEKRLKSYLDIIREKEREINLMKLNTRRLAGIIANINQYYILKKLDTLGSSQYETRKVLLNIQEGDLLFVDNPNIVSKNTVEELKDKIMIILHSKPISKKLKADLPFVFISSRNLRIEDFGMIAAVEKKALEQEKEKQEVVASVIEKYKKERLQLI